MIEKKECHLNSIFTNKCLSGEFCNLVDPRLTRKDILYDISGKKFNGFCAVCLYDKRGSAICNLSHRRVMISWRRALEILIIYLKNFFRKLFQLFRRKTLPKNTFFGKITEILDFRELNWKKTLHVVPSYELISKALSVT